MADPNLTVVYTDPLGEGSGIGSPRVPGTGSLHDLGAVGARLAAGPEASARTPRHPALLRRTVGFRTRKHYLDRWLAWEPGPLAALDLSAHPARQTHAVDIEPVLLRAARGEGCPLWKEESRTFQATHLPADDLLADAASWEPGWYVLTGVATDKYLGLYGQEVGTMGQVHLFLLDATVGGRADRSPEDWTLWHASTMRGLVFEDRLGRLLGNTRTIYRGFVPYRVTDPGPAVGPTPVLTRRSWSGATEFARHRLPGRLCSTCGSALRAGPSATRSPAGRHPRTSSGPRTTRRSPGTPRAG